MVRNGGGAKAARGGFETERYVANAIRNRLGFGPAFLTHIGVPLEVELRVCVVPTRLSAEVAMDLLKLELRPTPQELKELCLLQKADIRIEWIGEGVNRSANVSVKNVGSKADFNQVDRRSVSTYQELWQFDDDLRDSLLLFTGDLKEEVFLIRAAGLQIDKKHRRVTFKNLPDVKKEALIAFFESNKRRIVGEIVQGRGLLSADYVVVCQSLPNARQFHLTSAANAIDVLAEGEVVGRRSSLHLGKISMQRYGGSPNPERLQFKLRPSDILKAEGVRYLEQIV